MRNLLLLAAFAALSACGNTDAGASGAAGATAPAKLVPVTIASSNGRHAFQVEVAATAPEQERGLMFRTNIPKDGGMIFTPYPPQGGAPREASFWMKNTPSPLDILFIRADGTIARIAENAIPFSETALPSGEPVAAILEINGGRSAELGIAPDDKVTWPGHN
jgi:uncharacterized membrane protein (UPF0127 family)